MRGNLSWPYDPPHRSQNKIMLGQLAAVTRSSTRDT